MCRSAVPMTGGKAIAETLIANGVTTLFGLPGAQTYPLFDALAQRRDIIRTVSARHEQGSAYMAFGAAKSTGKPHVYSVVPGAGVLNTTAALSTAYATSTPVLCVTGQVPRAFLGRGRGHLHEIPDQLGLLKTLTKWSARIERVEDAPEIVNEAFRQMLTGRPGPVAVEMSWDTMAETAPVTLVDGVSPPVPAAADAAEIAAALAVITAARRPMIMVGGGAQHAAAAILALAERLDAPVAAFRGGRGIVAETHPLGLSSAAAHALWPETDVVIGIGSRLEMPTMRWTGMMGYFDRLPGGRKLVRIDIDPAEMVRLLADAPVVADARVATEALVAALGPKTATDEAARARIAAAKASLAAAIVRVQPEIGYLEVIRAALPDDGFFVPELCQAGFTSYFGFDVRTPRTYVTEGYQGTLGFGFPTALGVKAIHPERAVVSVTGDGGFMFAMPELATAVREGIGLVTVVFDNHAYGNVRRDQQRLYDGRVIASELTNPDFARLAEVMGADGYRADSPAALAPVLAKALAANRPAVIHVDVGVDREASPWEFIHFPP
jgi:acetolactate synthase-1/2/3 large subunit